MQILFKCEMFIFRGLNYQYLPFVDHGLKHWLLYDERVIVKAGLPCPQYSVALTRGIPSRSPLFARLIVTCVAHKQFMDGVA